MSRQPFEQFEGGQHQEGPPIGQGTRQPVDEARAGTGKGCMAVKGMETLEREGGPSAVAAGTTCRMQAVALDAVPIRTVDAACLAIGEEIAGRVVSRMEGGG